MGHSRHDRSYSKSVKGTNQDDVLDASDATRGKNIDAKRGDDLVTGSAFDDRIDADRGNDTVNAGDGDDRITGKDDNQIDAGAGNDSVYTSDGDDSVDGGDGNDRIYAGDGENTVDGGVGDDRIRTGRDDDSIDGGDGNDEIDAGRGDNTISGGAGDDEIDVDCGNSVIDGGDGNDEIDAGRGNHTIDGGAGDDEIEVDRGNSVIAGGDGNDEIEADHGNHTIDGGAGDDKIETKKGDSSITGGDGDDDIEVGRGNNTIEGGAGDDTIEGDKHGFDTAVYAGSILDFEICFTGSHSDGCDRHRNDHGRGHEEHGKGHGWGHYSFFGFGYGHHSRGWGDQLTVTDLTGAEGTDTLRYIDVLQFSDATIYLDGTNNVPVVGLEDQTVTESGTVAFPMDLLDFDGDGVTIDSVSSSAGVVSYVFVESSDDCLSRDRYELTFDTNGEFEGLAVGETAEVTVTVVVDDGNGGLVTKEVVVTVTGDNDAPTLGAAVMAAEEDGASVALDLAAYGDDIDSDDDGTTLVYTVTGAPAEGSASITGTVLTFDPGSDFQDLAEGETRDVVVGVTATDAHGATAVNSVTVTVTGTNDAPTVVVTPAAGWVEAADASAQVLSDAGTVSFDDIDATDVVDITFASNGDMAWSGGALGAGVAAALEAGFATGVVDADAPGSTAWTYATQAALDFLAEGETITWSYTVTATDSQGATATDVVSFTVTGTNDAPSVAATASAGFAEAADASAQVLSDAGTVSFDDIDATDTVDVTFAVNSAPVWSGGALSAAQVAALEAGFATGTSGAAAPGAIDWTYDATLDLDFLADGETITFDYLITATDSQGATATDVVSFTVIGTNDAPEITSAAVDVTLTEALSPTDLTASGTITFADLDSTDTHVVLADPVSVDYALAGGAPAPAPFSAAELAQIADALVIQPDGSWSLLLPAGLLLDRLSAGDTLTLSTSVTVQDDSGTANDSSAAQPFEITVVGTNDAPSIIGANVAGAVTEITDNAPGEGVDDLTATGSVTFVDIDSFDEHTVSVTPQGTGYLGSFTVPAGNVSGPLQPFGTIGTINWTFEVNDGALDFLAEGQLIRQTYEITVDDGQGGTATELVTIDITGRNDGPEIVTGQPGATEGTVVEAASDADGGVTDAGTPSATGQIVAFDQDTGAVLTWSGDAAGTYGAFAIDPMTGVWTYTLDNAAADPLAEGETATETFTATVTDDQGATATETVTITVTGSNDAPIAQAVSGSVEENPTSADLAAAIEADTLAPNAGRFYVFDFDTGTAATILRDGGANNTYAQVAASQLSGGNGVVIQINPNNSGWGIAASLFDGGVESVIEETNWTVTDSDGGPVTFGSAFGSSIPGLVYFDDPNKLVDEAAISLSGVSLSDGRVLDLNARLVGIDYEINTTDDVLVDAVRFNATLTDPEADTVTVLADFSDVDASDTHTFSVDTTGTQGAVVNNLDGSFTYSANGAFEYLAVGETATDTFTYTVDDGNGGTDTETVTITIQGLNDGPRIALTSPDTDAETLVETDGGLSVSSSLSYFDVDMSDTVTAAVTAVTTSGAVGAITLSEAQLLAMLSVDTNPVLTGVESAARRGWTFDSGAEAFDGLAVGESLVLTYTVTATDSQGAQATHDIEITIEGSNDVPTVSVSPSTGWTEAADASAQVLADAGTVSFDDIDVSDTIDVTYSINGAPVWSGGTLSGAQITALVAGFSTGVTGAAAPGAIPWTYNATLDLDFLAVGETITFEYTVAAHDSGGQTATDVVSFTITGTNDGPVAVGDVNGADTIVEAGLAVAGDASATGNVLANDTDADATDALSVSAVAGAAGNVGLSVAGTYGAVVIGADGSWTYTLDDGDADTQALAVGESVTDVFTYAIADGNGGADTATLTVTITGSNDGPVATADDNAGDAVVEAGVTEPGDATATGNVLANDSDIDAGDVLSVSAVNGAAGNVGASVTGVYGSVVIAADGSWTYTLDDADADTQALKQGQSVTDAFTYEVSDGNGGTATTTLVVTITGSNDAPEITSAPVSATVQAESLEGSFTAAELVADSLATSTRSYSVAQGPAGEMLEVGQANVGTVGQFMTASELLAPGAVASGASGSISISLPRVISGDDDLFIGLHDGTRHFDIIMTDTGNPGWGIVQSGVLDGAGTGFGGFDFGFEETFGSGAVAVSQINLVIEFNAGQQRLILLSEDGSSQLGASSWGTFIDPSAGLTLFTAPGDENEEYLFGPIDYDINLPVQPTVTGQVTATDVDVDATLSFSATTGVLYGVLSLDGTTGEWSYQLDNAHPTVVALADGQPLVETFTVAVTDEHGATDTQVVTITIEGANDDPVAAVDNNAGAPVIEAGDAVAGQPTATGNVLANDSDVDTGDVLSVTAIDGVAANVGTSVAGTYGAVVIAADGSWTYTLDDANPATQALSQGQVVTEVFTYEVSDGNGGTDTATLTVTVTGSNDAPVAAADANGTDVVVEEGSSVPGDASATGNVLANDSDVDASDVLSVSAVNGVAGNVGTSVTGTYGALVIAADGSWTYTLDDNDPDTEALGAGEVVTEVFTYEVSDGNGGTDTATLTIAITGSEDNRPPVAADATRTATEDIGITGAVPSSDPDLGLGDTLTHTVESGPSNGTLTLYANGAYLYLPDANYSGPDSFTYRVTDAAGETDTGTITIDVEAVADTPDLSVSASGAGGEEPQLIGQDIQINTTTNSAQRFPKVAELESGGFVVTWSNTDNSGPDTSGYGILAQIFDANGNKVGGEIAVNTNTNSAQIRSVVDSLPDGGFIITWEDGDLDGSGYAVVQQRFDANGAKVGTEQQVNTFTVNSQSLTDVTVLQDGGWVVSWSSYNQAGDQYNGVYYQRFDATGAAVGTETRANQYTQQNQTFVSTAALPDGGWLMSWSSYDQDGSQWGVYMRRYDVNGVATSGEQQVNSYTLSGQLYSRVDVLEDGGWVVAWASASQDGSGYGVYGQRYDAAGNTVGGEFQVNTYTNSTQYYPMVEALADGGWMISFTSYAADGSFYGVRGQRYAADGTAIGGEVTLTSRTLDDQFAYGHTGGSALAQLSNGTLVAVYEEEFGNGEIYASLLDVGGLGGLEDTTFAINLSAALTDTDGSETLELVLTGFPAGAVFNLGASDGNGGWVIPNAQSVDLSTLTITPPADWNGSFDLTVVATATESSNGDTASVTQTATVSVGAVNDAPVAVDDTASTLEDTAVTIDVTANDSDPVEGDAVSVISATGAAHGTLSIDTKGTTDTTDDEVVYTPDAHFSGTDSFTYTLRDAEGETATGSVDVTVEAVADAPLVSLLSGNAAPVLDGADRQVNVWTSDTQRYPRIAALEDGGFLVTWSSNNQDGSGWGVFARRYDADGNATTGDIQINLNTSSAQLFATPVSLPDGGYIVAWSDTTRDGNSYGVVYQRFDVNGNRVGGEDIVNTYASSNQYYQDITVLNDAGWLITWASANQDGSGFGIYQQRYDSSGAKVGGEERVNTWTNDQQNNPSVVALADGGWLTTWSSVEQSGSNWDVYSQRFGANGLKVGPETLVNDSYTSGLQIYSHVDTLPDGGWIIAWHGAGAGVGSSIYFQRYDANGATVNGPVQVTDTVTSNSYAHVEVLDDGGWIISFNGYQIDGSAYGIAAQRYAADGAPVGDETVITSRTYDDQYTYGFLGGTAIVQLANGQLATVYEEDFGVSEIFLTLADLPSGGGLEDTAFPILLGAELVDQDGSETLELVLTGFPAGATFNLGQSDGTGGWVIADAQTVDLTTLTMTPPADWNGDFDLTVTATATETSNGDTATSTTTRTLTIEPANDAPMAGDDTVAAQEDVATTIATAALLANDTDIDGDAVTVSAVDSVSDQGGSVSWTGTDFVYTSAQDFNGTDSFDYQITDGNGEVSTATVTVEVTPVNDAPEITGTAAQFSGATGDRAQLNNVSGFPSTAFTMSAMIRIDNPNGLEHYISYANSVTDNGLILRTAGDQLGVIVMGGNGGQIQAPGVNDGNVHHIAITHDGLSTATIYYDGVVLGTLPGVTFPPIASGGILMLGHDQDSLGGGLSASQSLRGAMDKVGIWSRALSAAEIADLGNGIADTTDTDLFAYWSYDAGTQSFDDLSANGNDLTTIGSLPPVGFDPQPVSVMEDSSLAITGLQVSDLEATTLSVTLTVAEGTVDFGSLTGVTISAGAAGSDTVTITGATADVNAALRTLSYTPDADFAGTDSLIAVVDDLGATGLGGAQTANLTLPITVLDTNDAPVAYDQTFEAAESFAVQPVTTSGQLAASDIDLGDTLTWTAGTFATAHGSVTVNSDGSFDYVPNAGYVGLDSFTATVSDAEGLTDTAEVRVEVATEEFTSPGGQQVSLDLNADPTGDSPAGAMSISLSPYQSPAVNLAIAMDSSGSVGNSGWNEQKSAVQQALTSIAGQFDGTGVDVDAHVFGFSGTSTGALYLQVADGTATPATMTGAPGTLIADVDLDTTTVNGLNAQIGAMVFPQGATPWDAVFQQAEAYFDAEFLEDGANALNLMLFITDGNPYPTSQPWQQSLANLLNDDFTLSNVGLPGAGTYQQWGTDTYSVDLQAFGVGSGLNINVLNEVDSDGAATPVNTFQDLTAALNGSGLFPAELVSLDVTLTADGNPSVGIADEMTPGLDVGTLSIDLALADIAGIEDLLGDVNEFAVEAVFDLDGDLGTTSDRVTLNSLEQIAYGDEALVFAGTDGNDLSLGSDGDDEMNGGLGDDLLLAGLGADTVTGGAGDDRLGGGAGEDDFVFAAGDGLDTIIDYSVADDQITFTGGIGYGDLTIAQAGSDVTIAYGSDVITVENATATDFIADEFVFL